MSENVERFRGVFSLLSSGLFGRYGDADRKSGDGKKCLSGIYCSSI
jgi:hypothetical protein